MHNRDAAAPSGAGGRRRAAVVSVWAAALLAALLLVHSVAFDAPFYFDSRPHLVTKTNLHMVELSWESLSDAVRFDFGGGGLYRPVSYLSLALNHYFGGLSPRGFRIVNAGIHWGAALALVFLSLSAAAAPRVRARHPGLARIALPASLIAATLWALHPIQTNVVTYVIQRMASLAGIFSFLSVGAYLRARSGEAGFRWGWGAASLLCLGLAVGAKESAITVVPLLLLTEPLLLEPPRSPSVRRAVWVAVGGAALLAGAALSWKGLSTWDYLVDLSAVRSFTPWERLLTQFRLQPWYLMLLLVPDPRLLSLGADVEVSRGLLLPPSTLLGLVAIALAVASAIVLRRRFPLLAFGILWFFAAQLTEGTVIPLELYYEHRMYVPSAFLYLGLGVLASALWLRPGVRRVVASCAVAAMVATGAAATMARNRVWADPVKFWSDAVAKDPDAARPYTNLGQALLEAGRWEEAYLALQDALAKGGRKSGTILVNLGVASQQLGDPNRAREYFTEAIASQEDARWLAYRGRGKLSLMEGRTEEAEADLREALRRREGDAETWSLLATVSALREDWALAEEQARTAVRYGPNHSKAWNNLGFVCFQRGRFTEALEAFRKASALAPQEEQYSRNAEAALRAASGDTASTP